MTSRSIAEVKDTTVTPYRRTSCTNRSGCKPRDKAIRAPLTTAPPSAHQQTGLMVQRREVAYGVHRPPSLAAVDAVPNADNAQRKLVICLAARVRRPSC